MNKKEIDILLNKYWETETSISEEKALKEYFMSNEIHSSHLVYKDLFAVFNFESQRQAKTELSLTDDHIRKYTRQDSLLFRIRPLLKFAASMLLLIAAFSYFSSQYNTVGHDTIYAGKYTEFKDPAQSEEALEITLDALSFLGVKINKTETEIRDNLKPVRKAIRKVNKL